MIHRIDPIIGRVVICQCPNPIIKCDQYDCICTGCGLPSIHDLSLGKKSKGLKDETIIEHLLLSIGEDPEREGLKETPARVIKAWKEWASGYNQKPEEILKCFEDGADGVDELVIVHNVPVISKCEHHLADIVGIAHVGYIPNRRIVGLSKLARLVDCFSRRLQVQERLTNQIANSIQQILNPVGVGVLIRAAHGCMSTRGVKIHGSETSTSAMRGVLRTEASARAEFISLCRMAEKK